MESTLKANIRTIQTEIETGVKSNAAGSVNERDIQNEKIFVVNQKEASVSPISGHNQIAKS